MCLRYIERTKQFVFFKISLQPIYCYFVIIC